jgi:hypothetical protein
MQNADWAESERLCGKYKKKTQNKPNADEIKNRNRADNLPLGKPSARHAVLVDDHRTPHAPEGTSANVRPEDRSSRGGGLIFADRQTNLRGPADKSSQAGRQIFADRQTNLRRPADKSTQVGKQILAHQPSAEAGSGIRLHQMN